MSLNQAKATSPPTAKKNAPKSKSQKNLDPNKAPPPRKRTKTGCRTCRKRRIKCDEGKPHCNNCIKAHRECEGYQQRLDFRDGLTLKQRRSHIAQQSNSTKHQQQSSRKHNSNILVSSTFVQPDNSLTTQFISMQNTQELSDSSPPANNINHSPQPPGPVVYITPTPTLSPISSYGHYSPQSQAYSLQQHRTNLFPQLFSEIANQSREQLNDVTFYTPSASNSPLMLDTIYFLFDYFVRNFGAGMSLVSRLPPNPEILYNSEDRRGRENFWTYDAPLMALNNPHILNAMLALSSLHYSRVNKDAALDPVAFNSMTYYQNAVRGLRESIVVQKHTDTLATLTTCLLLAFYETMYGDLMKWYTHMAGAKDIIVNWGLCKVASGARDLYDVGEISEFLSPTEIKALQTADLVSMFLYMDLLQSTIGSSQMLLSLEDIDLLPLRGAPSSKVFIFDSLVKCSAKISSWVASEHVRKEKLYPKNEPHPELTKEDYMNLAQATILWESLRDELQTLETRFGPYIAPLPLRGPPVLTPFGPSSVYKSAFDMFLTTFLHMNWLIIKRNRPDIPTFGMETLRYAAEDGVPHLIVIFRSLPPVIPPAFAHSNDENLDSGQTIRLVIEISVAAFFAGIQVRDPAQQKWVEWWFQQCYQYTGWSTAQTIIQGIKRGWGAQKAAIERMMEARERSAGSSPSHASSSPSASEDTLSPLPNSGSSPISTSIVKHVTSQNHDFFFD